MEAIASVKVTGGVSVTIRNDTAVVTKEYYRQYLLRELAWLDDPSSQTMTTYISSAFSNPQLRDSRQDAANAILDKVCSYHGVTRESIVNATTQTAEDVKLQAAKNMKAEGFTVDEIYGSVKKSKTWVENNCANVKSRT